MSLHLFFSDQKTISRFCLQPLGKYMNAYAKWLHERGYSWDSGRSKIRCIARFSQWLNRCGIAPKDLCEKHLQIYLNMKVQKSPQFNKNDGSALRQYLRFLQEKGVNCKPTVAELTPAEHLISAYTDYLANERALALGSIAQYKRHVSRFLSNKSVQDVSDLSALKSYAVTTYVRMNCGKKSKKDAKLMCSALRSFFQYALYQGYIDKKLEASVLAVANWRMASIPRYLPLEKVQRILAGCDRQTKTGKRDYVILLLLARLGLRAGEIVALSLDDIDWYAGVLLVRGKGSTLAQMPLPPDVGEALAAYLQFGRPSSGSSGSRQVFLTSHAPIRAFRAPSAVSSVVAHAIRSANVTCESKGAHQFRHTLATQLLQQGASLPEVAEVLRHRTLDCTTIYAKVDLQALRTLALEWPGGVT